MTDLLNMNINRILKITSPISDSLVDRVIELEPTKRIKALKNVS
jgi:3-hydroxyacyl-[acyl-carrier-protein] dehydratase